MSLERNGGNRRPDPRRRDPWLRGAGRRDPYRREPKRLFLGMLFLSVASVFAAACVLLWAIFPRLQMLHPAVAVGTLSFVGVFGVAFLTMFTVLGISLMVGSASALADNTFQALARLYPLVAWFARRLGIAEDKLRRSVLDVQAEMTRCRLRRNSNGRILCVVPKSVSKGAVEQIQSMVSEYDCDLLVAANVASAQEHVKQTRPAALIVVGYDRDFDQHVRPSGYFGPYARVSCRGAFASGGKVQADLHELRETIELFKERFESAALEIDDHIIAGLGD